MCQIQVLALKKILFQNYLFRIDEKNIQAGTNGERGTGLGLIICKDLISRINGSIRVESQLGNGSSFYIRLPQMEIDDV